MNRAKPLLLTVAGLALMLGAVPAHSQDHVDELPLDEFLVLFPEGEYRFVGVTTDGSPQLGVATFSHVLQD